MIYVAPEDNNDIMDKDNKGGVIIKISTSGYNTCTSLGSGLVHAQLSRKLPLIYVWYVINKQAIHIVKCNFIDFSQDNVASFLYTVYFVIK